MTPLKRPDFESTRLLLVDCDERAQASLQKSLQRLGVAASVVAQDAETGLNDVLALVVELDRFASPELLAEANRRALPIIALTQHETLSQIQRALELGATAMLNKPITQGSVYTTLMMAIGLRDRLRDEQQKVVGLQDKVDSRPLVAQALAWLMVELEITETQAYERIRHLSMQTNRSLEEICLDLTQAHRQDAREARS
ncbi:ANTAR domain-containing response regulator [Pseudomonas luteola]|uniref:ANTAR domain-containing response regulator n=1 Tax=Pseudomonas luteola TaxID=47886 RepID=UPI00123BE8FE|nr:MULTISPECIES: ANTAR domain-containing protein [Pseudomonas]MBA1247126.1 ANTAR domain-containing protein [Pseudomonas zeshuii]QEU28252.1 ANTAR domain-containing protein [Pseudomonas luteola]